MGISTPYHPSGPDRSVVTPTVSTPVLYISAFHFTTSCSGTTKNDVAAIIAGGITSIDIAVSSASAAAVCVPEGESMVTPRALPVSVTATHTVVATHSSLFPVCRPPCNAEDGGKSEPAPASVAAPTGLHSV